jgi:hypothetical protein
MTPRGARKRLRLSQSYCLKLMVQEEVIRTLAFAQPGALIHTEREQMRRGKRRERERG